jgi:hypothetical protein
MKGSCVPGCIACREEQPHPHVAIRDSVQVQKEAWEQIAREEREGKRQPPVVRWAA